MWSLSGYQTRQSLRQSRSQRELLSVERTSEQQNLSQQLLKVQDEERRRMARDLHDSAGQTLTALKISVALLQRKLERDKGICDELSGIASLVDEALQEIRTTSYLLHPPMLDEAGFGSAAQWYVEGFAKRSGMNVRMDFTTEAQRLTGGVEIALFRVLQEGLTNVHRHSGTSEVDIRFRREANAVVLELRDYGCGMPAEWLGGTGPSLQDFGVGLAGMRERLHELKGTLEIEPAHPGTRLRATVPVWNEPGRSAQDEGFSSISPPSPACQIHPVSARNSPSC
jgi:two-component system, NarL family, sensor kinase